MRTKTLLLTTLIAAFPLNCAISEELSAPPAITDSGASALTRAIEAYIGRASAGEPAIFSAKPNGQNYAFTLDPTALISTMKDKISITPIVGQITPIGDNKWSITYTGNIEANVKDQNGDSQTRLEGVKSSQLFDASMMATRSQKTEITRMVSTTFSPASKGRPVIIKTVDKIHIDAESTAHDEANVNTRIVETTGPSTITMALPGQDNGFELKSSATKILMTAEGFHSRALFELWAWLVNHQTRKIADYQEDLRPLLRAIVPAFERIDGKYEISNVSSTYPNAKFGAATITSAVAINGPARPGFMSVSGGATGITADIAAIPTWAKPLMPSEFAFGVEYAGYKLAPALNTLIDHFNFKQNDILPADIITQIATSLLPSGVARIKLSNLHFKSEIYDLNLDGYVTVGPTARPAGAVTIRAKGIDKVVAILNEAATTTPQIAQQITILKVAEAMAKHDATGQSIWEISSTDGSLTVNGNQITPPGAQHSAPVQPRL